MLVIPAIIEFVSVSTGLDYRLMRKQFGFILLGKEMILPIKSFLKPSQKFIELVNQI